MEKNIGQLDKVIRTIIAIVLIGLGYFYSFWWLYLIAVITAITIATGFCLPYKWLGINTLRKAKKKR